MDDCVKRYIRFAPARWDVPALMAGSGWTKAGRILLFEFQNQPGRLVLKLYVGPGPQQTREKVHQLAQANAKTFPKSGRPINSNWTQIFVREFLSPRDFEDEDGASIERVVRSRWDAFMAADLPAIVNVVSAADWLLPESES